MAPNGGTFGSAWPAGAAACALARATSPVKAINLNAIMVGEDSTTLRRDVLETVDVFGVLAATDVLPLVVRLE